MKSILVYRRFSDLDPLGHVNNVVFYDYLQEARLGLIEDTNLVFGHGFAQLVVEQQVRYVQPLAYGREPIRIDVWLSSLARSSYVVDYVIHDDNDTVVATAVSKLAVVDEHTGRPIRIPEKVLERLSPHLISD
ncbi:MAG: acyl-CoA thioesterase [Candidatus Nanopelagicales bacterium]